MSQFFPEIPEYTPDNVMVATDFDLMKRKPLHHSFVGYNQHVFKYKSNDRFIPSRHLTTSEFLRKTPASCFDISLPTNSVAMMKKVQYQNHIRKMFIEDQEKENILGHSKDVKLTPLVHKDWACKISHLRLKFLPDFETLKKPGFGFIYNYIWSSKQIIAASSRRKVCLYHPFNGFTRALDVSGRVTIAFSNNGNFLAMAYRKSERDESEHDIFVFRIDHKTLFDSEILDTEKIRTSTPHDITALCYTQHDDFLVCGTDAGKIVILECIPPANFSSKNPKPHQWHFVKLISSSFHKKEIKKICFSAKFRYMASLDLNGQLVIWNGGSFTVLFCLQKENSSLYKHLQWHPFVEEELIFGKSSYPALYLINVVQKEVVACHMNWRKDMEITSVAFNPVNAQLAICIYIHDECINRVSILASMSQVLNTYDFDYIHGGLKLFWNSTGSMLGAGGQCFRFAFWSFEKTLDFSLQTIKGSKSKNPVLITLNDSKLSSLR